MTDLLKPSADYLCMSPYWAKVDAITAGVEAMRSNSREYLPPFPAESLVSYNYRVQSSRLTDIFSDIVESLAAKPFAREAGLADDDMPPQIVDFVDDVDQSGNHLHVFAQQMFFSGITYGVDWVIVEYPQANAGDTLADESKSGARPYFIRIRAQDLLDVRSEVIGGRELFTYLRINESDETAQRVRVYERGEAGVTFSVFEKSKESGEWVEVERGVLSLPEIPLVPFYTGRRIPGAWRFTLPMKRIADLQVEHYQQETNLKLTKESSCFPMLVGEGITPPTNEKGQPISPPVGPAAILYAPMNQEGAHGTWRTIEPSAQTLQFLAEQIAQTESAMRELGRMPITSGTAGITQVAAAAASQRASSAVQAWAYALKDALEKAMRYAALWMGLDVEPTVYIDTDFAISIGDDKAPELLVSLQKDGLISVKTLLQELKRRSILSPEVDAESEAELVLEESAAGEADPDPRDSGGLENGDDNGA